MSANSMLESFVSTLKLQRYRIYNQQVDLVNNTGPSGVNPLVINDTSAVSTTATAYTQVKSYSINIPNNDFGRRVINAIRVQIQGYVNAGTGYVEVLINGVAPTMIKTIVGSGNSNSFTNTSSALIFDGIISLSGVASPYTLSIDAYNGTSGDTTYISDVYGYQGLAITSTSATTIDQQETTYPILDEIGLTYVTGYSGLHLIAHACLNTTATSMIVGTDNFTPSGKTSATLQAGAENNSPPNAFWWYLGDNDGNDQIPTGYNGPFTYTVTANVGASGDVLIIGTLRATFNIHTVSFPRGPHMGFLETVMDAYGGAPSISIRTADNQSTWTGYYGQELTLFSISPSGYANNQGGGGWFITDETTYLINTWTGHEIVWHLLVEVLE